jgi:predicted RecA/RadA family phage recombinase
MKNLAQDGNVLTLPAPSGGVDSGDFVLIGDLLCVAITDGAQTVPTAFNVAGVHKAAPADNATAFLVGDILYWNATDGKFFKSADGGTGSGHPAKGHAVEAKSEAGATCVVRIQQ